MGEGAAAGCILVSVGMKRVGGSSRMDAQTKINAL